MKIIWEYKLVSCATADSTELVADMGMDGWEMCGFSYDQPNHRDHFWFKRRKTD